MFDGQIIESKRTANLKAACALITPRNKWTVGVRKDNYGAMCALGALDEVMGNADTLRYVRTHKSEEVKLLAKYTDKPRLIPLGAESDAHFVALHNNYLGHAATLAMFHAAISESIEMDALAVAA